MRRAEFGGGGNAEPLRISFFGNNNTIVIARSAKLSGLINIFGDNNSISFSPLSQFSSGIYIGKKDDLVRSSNLCFGEGCKISNSNIDIVAGSNQVLNIGNNSQLNSVYIEQPGKSEAHIGHNVSFFIKSQIRIGLQSELNIGDNTTINEIFINSAMNSKIDIGQDCMFSWSVVLFPDDCHPIMDKETGKLLNSHNNNNIHIGKHCWIGYGVTLLKNVTIPDNSIVGMNSFVINKQFDEPNVIIAGSPAKVIKHNIDWDRDIPQVYKEKLKENEPALL